MHFYGGTSLVSIQPSLRPGKLPTVVDYCDWPNNKLTLAIIRYGHTMVAINTTLHLFGGRDDTDVFNDHFILNTGQFFSLLLPVHAELINLFVDDLEWHEVSTTGAPSPRYHHSAVVHGHKVYIFGKQYKRMLVLRILT